MCKIPSSSFPIPVQPTPAHGQTRLDEVHALYDGIKSTFICSLRLYNALQDMTFFQTIMIVMWVSQMQSKLLEPFADWKLITNWSCTINANVSETLKIKNQFPPPPTLVHILESKSECKWQVVFHRPIQKKYDKARGGSRERAFGRGGGACGVRER